MSNNRPTISLPNRPATPPPPPSAAVPPPPGAQGSQAPKIPDQFAEVVSKFPLPWIVGPFDATDNTYMIFVKGDVEPVKDESRMNEHGAVFNGWVSLVPRPRFVVSLPLPKVMCEFFVFAVNRLVR
jgi:hypothetical protein